jgi:CHAT domain-containing protein
MGCNSFIDNFCTFIPRSSCYRGGAMKHNIFFILFGLCVVCPCYQGFSFQAGNGAEIAMERAEVFFEVSNYKKALQHYSIAANNFKIQKNWSGYLNAVAGKAYSLVRLNAFDDAKLLLDTAVIVGHNIGESIEVARVYYVYGILLDLLNEPIESLAMHQQALNIRVRLLGSNHILVSESYNGIGEVYRYTLRDYVEAEKYFQKSVNILEVTPRKYLKQLYRVYYNLATTNRLKKDFERALGFAFSAIQTLESIDPVDTTSFIRCYGIIANIYNNQNVSEKAILYYRKALSLRLDRREMSAEMANDFTNLSQAYIETGQHSLALHCVDSALLIIKNKNAYDSTTMADIYLVKGKTLREANRDQEAIENYRRSLRIRKAFSQSNTADISNTYKHLSEVLYKMKQYDSALFYSQQSIQSALGSETTLSSTSNPSYKVLENKPRLYDILAHKGTVLMQLAEGRNAVNTLKLAAECFYLSDRLMDRYWDSQENENSKLHFASDTYYIYERALSALYKLYGLTSDEQYIASAFELMDKSKARILRQGVEQASQRAQKYIPDSILTQELNIKAKITSVENKLGSVKDLEVESELNVELLNRQKELAVWQRQIKKQFPQYAFEARKSPVMTLHRLQEALEGDMIFVEYFFGTEMIYAIASFDGEQGFVAIENKNLTHDIYKFCELLKNGLQTKDLQEDFANYLMLGSSLYEDLLQPIINRFGLQVEDDRHQLMVVPDGPLSLLPFQALLASKPNATHVNYRDLDYLVKHFTISYSFDAVSPFLPNPRSHSEKPLLAFGWSDGEQEKYTTNDLPGTYRELQAIASIFPGDFSMGKEAVKKKFMAEASSYNILHLAIHGVGDEHDIYNNYLQFRDEKLFAHELYGYNLGSDLTVLSACETGYGKIFTAEGVYSIARGFFYAGSKSLLMTLWRINDGENVSLIYQFYKNLAQNEYASSALCKSQLTYLKQADELTAHPRFWVGLVLWGNYKEVNDQTISVRIYALAILVGLATAASLFFIRKKKKTST